MTDLTTLVVVLVLSVTASIGFLLGSIWGVAMHLHKLNAEDFNDRLKRK